MAFCPECGCQLDITKGVVLCTNCTFSECHCELCSMQDEIIIVQKIPENEFSNNNKMKGEDDYVE